MKRLVLMRHGDACAYHPHGDRSRELSATGQARSQTAGAALQGPFDTAIVSDATRTRQTFEHLRLGIEPNLAPWLYNSYIDALEDALAELSEDVTAAIVVGHAPTVPALAARLADIAEPGNSYHLSMRFTTSQWVEFTIDAPWADISTTTNITLVRVYRP